ncbi:hypothetical protein B2J93_9522 [Marssonina coronariae]|uniref:Uncharacterized protein n=1 Tax=Diplocarpon coronariae TaxID=2795749 RepID=A0A218ZGP1_9HELO|nr:hypothetical protein B2J93_9522 [Marssonina coronariae]
MGIFRRLTDRSSISTSSSSSASPSGYNSPTNAYTLFSTRTLSPTTSPTSTTPDTTSPGPFSPPKRSTTAPQLRTHSSRLHFGWLRSSEERQRRRIAAWEREDQNEWDAPTPRERYSGGGKRKLAGKAHQEALRAFEFRWREDGDGPSGWDRERERAMAPDYPSAWASEPSGPRPKRSRQRRGSALLPSVLAGVSSLDQPPADSPTRPFA